MLWHTNKHYKCLCNNGFYSRFYFSIEWFDCQTQWSNELFVKWHVFWISSKHRVSSTYDIPFPNTTSIRFELKESRSVHGQTCKVSLVVFISVYILNMTECLVSSFVLIWDLVCLLELIAIYELNSNDDTCNNRMGISKYLYHSNVFCRWPDSMILESHSSSFSLFFSVFSLSYTQMYIYLAKLTWLTNIRYENDPTQTIPLKCWYRSDFIKVGAIDILHRNICCISHFITW